MSDAADGFLSRWARRKAEVRDGAPPRRPTAPAEPATAPEPPSAPAARATPAPPAEATRPVPTGAPDRGAGLAAAATRPDAAVPPVATGGADALPPPTLDDVAQLTHASDYSRFVAGGVDDGVKRAALKKLFTDPHFNVMDGLDTYIDDYGIADPIPLAMLRRMNQSALLGLFDAAPDEAPEAPEASDPGIAAVPSDPNPTVAAVAATEPANPPDDDADLRLQQDDAAGRTGAGEGART